MALWPSTSYNDFTTVQTFHKVHDLDTDIDFHRIKSGFDGAFATGVACQQKTLILPGRLVPSPFFGGFPYAPILKTSFPEIAMSLLDFSPYYI